MPGCAEFVVAAVDSANGTLAPIVRSEDPEAAMTYARTASQGAAKGVHILLIEYARGTPARLLWNSRDPDGGEPVH